VVAPQRAPLRLARRVEQAVALDAAATALDAAAEAALPA